MKKTIIAIILLMLIATVAFAGPLDFVKDKIAGIGWAGLWAGLSIVLGAIGAITGVNLLKWKKLGQEIQQAVTVYQTAGDPKSPGGVKRTAEEWESIGREGMEVIVAAVEAFGIKEKNK
jgi:hypothetical protein